MDLTEETDDTSLGADLLDEVFDSEDDEFTNEEENSELFESPEESLTNNEFESPTANANNLVAANDPYDGLWSGIVGGSMIAASVSLSIVGSMLLLVMTGSPPELSTLITNEFLVWSGGLGALTIVFSVIGSLIGRASE